MNTAEQKINGLYVVVHKPDEQLHTSPLVLVHGSFGASWMWNMYVKFFVDKGFTVITFDLRGHGMSEGGVAGATMQDYADDVATVVSGLGLANPVIIGHSMGGLVALMYVAANGAQALVSIGGSPTLEVMGEGSEQEYPETYTPMDVGMPADPMKVMQALPDIPKEMLMSMKEMLGAESGVARSDRKRGISVSQESIADIPKYFLGSELADTVGFGINAEWAHKHAKYYGGDVLEVQSSTHPGILVGMHAEDGACAIAEWIMKNVK